MSKNRLHSVVQRFNLDPPEGGLLTDKNKSWWDRQEFSDLTGFQVERDLEIVEHLEEQKEAIDQKLMELSNYQRGPQRAALGAGGGCLESSGQRSLLEGSAQTAGEEDASQQSYCCHREKDAGFNLAYPHQTGALSPLR
jgi:hypothetical protein